MGRAVTSNPSNINLDLLGLQTEFFTKLAGQGKSINTLKNYKTDLDCFNHYLQNEQNDLNITKFNIPEVKLYGNYLEARYNSDNSRRRRVQALRIFFDFLVEKNLFSANPVRKLPTSPKFLDIPRPTPFVDVKTLWVYLLEESENPNPMSQLLAKRNQVVMLLVYGGALKVSDLAKLSVKDIFLDKKKPRVMITGTKRDPYSIPLPPIFYTVCTDYLAHLEQMKKKSGLEFKELLFNANPYRILSGGLSPRGLEIIFGDFRKRLMITATPKSLRQASIFRWLQATDSDDSQIKEWLGVAPSYSLKLYREHITEHVYNEDFLEELHHHYFRKKK